MAGKMSTYLQDALAGALLANSAFTAPANHYAALFTALNESNSGDTKTEVSASGYIRQSVAFNAAASRATTNPTKVVFPEAPVSWGTPTYWGIFDQVSGGNLLYWGAVPSPLIVNTGEQFEIPASGMSVSHDGAFSDSIANSLLNNALHGNAFTPPAAVYVALMSAYTNDATYTELSHSTYARQAAGLTHSGTGTYSNAADVVFIPTPDGAYTVTNFAFFSAATNGTMLMRASLSSSKTVDLGKYFRFTATSLTGAVD